MLANRKQRPGQALRGVKNRKINNISCFINYLIDEEERVCDLEIYSRLRPGHIAYQIKDIDLDTFDLDDELCKLRLEMSEKPQAPTTARKTIREKLLDKGVPSEKAPDVKRKLTKADSLLSQLSSDDGEHRSSVAGPNNF